MHEYNLGLRFERVAADHRSSVALWFASDQTVTYGELNALANRMASFLVARGVGPQSVVCLAGDKSAQAFAGMIACLKIGAVYSFFDPDGPVERIGKIFSTCAPTVVLAGREVLDRYASIAAAAGAAVVERDGPGLAAALAHADPTNPPVTRSPTGASPAYIMFTSGSTGVPKGALMTHANVLNLVDWSVDTFGITPADVLTNLNALYFDNSVFDVYASLFTGARLVPFSRAEVQDPRRLVEKTAAAGCTTWFSVPSLLMFLQTMKAADGTTLTSVRRFVFGGEGYPKGRLKSLYEAYAASSELFNVYGPTECSCICSCHKVTARDFDDLSGLPPLGQIAGNFAFLILGDDGKSVRDGEVGELCLLGPNVGKGYYRDAERTAASFVQNPFNDRFPEIMYRTGDLVSREPPEGRLRIHGRKDNQVKHMGYRIELEEIEAALLGLDYVREAVVLHGRVNGLSRILAVLSAAGAATDDRIRRDLRRVIPDYMIPALFHREEKIPRGPNGKVDRLALAAKYLP
jgi:D-alanine--poly(phosphoribitol) ligase subunit 1